MNAGNPTISIVDDDISVREALKSLLRSVGWNAETFCSAQEFLASPYTSQPGCLILDVRLPGLSGLDLQRQLADADLQIPIIFITGHGDIPMSVRALKAGAVDFLSKPFRDQDLLDAVQEAVDRDRTSRLQRSEEVDLRARFASLSAREQEVMTLVVAGFLNKQIASRLGTSEATVKMHRGHMMQKMSVKSLAELCRIAEKLGLPATARL